jgi:hypothetical protein
MSITITVSGSGGAFGVGSISEDQYEYWIDREEDVVSAFQQDLDQSDVPENAQIDNHYDSYDDIGSVYGLYEDDVMIKITDSSDNVLFEGGYEDYFEFFNLSDIEDELTEDHAELYVPFMEQDSGYFVYWRNYQDGSFINCMLSEDKFDPRKLSFSSCDLNGEETLITSLSYDGIPLDIDLSDMSSISLECSLHENN